MAKVTNAAKFSKSLLKGGTKGIKKQTQKDIGRLNKATNVKRPTPPDLRLIKHPKAAAAGAATGTAAGVYSGRKINKARAKKGGRKK